MSAPYFQEITNKLWNLGKLAVPGVALYEFISYLIESVFGKFRDWVLGLIEGFQQKIIEQFTALQIDLAPPPEFAAFISKANVIVPLTEMWHFFLLYLGFASVVMGIKWARNLIPGVS